MTTQQWAERTPDDFVFKVKAFRLFTGHQTQPRVKYRMARGSACQSFVVRFRNRQSVWVVADTSHGRDNLPRA